MDVLWQHAIMVVLSLEGLSYNRLATCTLLYVCVCARLCTRVHAYVWVMEVVVSCVTFTLWNPLVCMLAVNSLCYRVMFSCASGICLYTIPCSTVIIRMLKGLHYRQVICAWPQKWGVWRAGLGWWCVWPQSGTNVGPSAIMTPMDAVGEQ